MQTYPVPQVPHESTPPHPSLGLPHESPSAAQVVFAQVSHWCVTASQTSLAGQEPQLRAFPQPLVAVPHMKPCEAHVSIWHAPQAHPFPVCWQDSPAGQVPQLSVLPQVSTTKPQVAWYWAQVVRGVLHALEVGLQNWLAEQVPQLSWFPQPSW